jgi:hypothetical protein
MPSSVTVLPTMAGSDDIWLVQKSWLTRRAARPMSHRRWPDQTGPIRERHAERAEVVGRHIQRLDATNLRLAGSRVPTSLESRTHPVSAMPLSLSRNA